MDSKAIRILKFFEVLFIIDDITANKDLEKRRQPLLELSISGRHRGHYLWLLTQSYKGIPKKLREQTKAIFVWYPKARIDLKMIHDENDVLTNNESRDSLNTDVPSPSDLTCFETENILLLHLK